MNTDSLLKPIIWIFCESFKVNKLKLVSSLLLNALSIVFQILGLISIVFVIGASEKSDSLSVWILPQIPIYLFCAMSISSLILANVCRLSKSILILDIEKSLIKKWDVEGINLLKKSKELKKLSPIVLSGSRSAGRISRLSHGAVPGFLNILLGCTLVFFVSPTLLFISVIFGLFYILATKPLAKSAITTSNNFNKNSILRRKSFRSSLQKGTPSVEFYEAETSFVNDSAKRIILVEKSRFISSTLLIIALASLLSVFIWFPSLLSLAASEYLIALIGLRALLAGFQVISSLFPTINKFLPKAQNLYFLLVRRNISLIENTNMLSIDDD